MSQTSLVLVSRRSVHHLVAELLVQACGGFTVGDHAGGAARPLSCRIVGSTQRDNAQGWIDSPGLALQFLGGERSMTPEALPVWEPRGPRYHITGAAPVYEADWRLTAMSAGAFDATDIAAQIEEFLRGQPNAGRVRSELIGTHVYLSDPVLPGLRLRVSSGGMVHNVRTDHMLSTLVLSVHYPLRAVEVDLPRLMAVGYNLGQLITEPVETAPTLTGDQP